MMKTYIKSGVIFLCIFLFAAGIGVSGETDTMKNNSQASASKETSEETYRISVGDELEIITWKEEDFTRDVTVRVDGKITFLLLDDLYVEGKTPVEVKNLLQEGLKNYVDNPVVTVFVKKRHIDSYFILGEIMNTGRYGITENLRVLQAVAQAGGFSEWASKKEILLLRRVNGKPRMIRIDYKKIIQGKELTQNVELKPNDTIIVP